MSVCLPRPPILNVFWRESSCVRLSRLNTGCFSRRSMPALTEYEKARLERIQQNQAALADLGVRAAKASLAPPPTSRPRPAKPVHRKPAPSTTTTAVRRLVVRPARHCSPVTVQVNSQRRQTLTIFARWPHGGRAGGCEYRSSRCVHCVPTESIGHL